MIVLKIEIKIPKKKSFQVVQIIISGDTLQMGLNNLIKLAKEKTSNIIIIPPTIMNENVLKGYFSSMLDKTSIKKSKEVRKIFKEAADKNNCRYFDLNEFVTPSEIDGLHYDEKSHKIIADKLTDFIRKFI